MATSPTRTRAPCTTRVPGAPRTGTRVRAASCTTPWPTSATGRPAWTAASTKPSSVRVRDREKNTHIKTSSVGQNNIQDCCGVNQIFSSPGQTSAVPYTEWSEIWWAFKWNIGALLMIIWWNSLSPWFCFPITQSNTRSSPTQDVFHFPKKLVAHFFIPIVVELYIKTNCIFRELTCFAIHICYITFHLSCAGYSFNSTK